MPGVCCPIITTCYCRLINFRICGLNLEGSTVVHRSNGTVRMIAEGGKFGNNCLDRGIKSHRHFWASVNYVHHNPVHHGYVDKWTEWPWSSAGAFVLRVGRETASKIWREYPILELGKTWDFD